MAQSIGKVNQNGTLNDGAFYSIQDVDVLMDGVTGDIDDIEGDITTIGGNITSLTGRVAALEQSGGGEFTLQDYVDSINPDTDNIILETAMTMSGGLKRYISNKTYAEMETLLADFPNTILWLKTQANPVGLEMSTVLANVCFFTLISSEAEGLTVYRLYLDKTNLTSITVDGVQRALIGTTVKTVTYDS